MLTTMTKLACFAGCAAIGLGSAWFALAAPVEAANKLKPCASLDEIISSGPGCMPLEAPGPCGPLDPVVVDSTDNPPADVAPDSPPLPVDTISYYRDGDRFEVTFTDGDEVVRRAGSYVLVLTDPKPAIRHEPLDKKLIDEVLTEELLQELQVRVEEIGKRIHVEKKLVSVEYTEHNSFDPKLVPPGKEYQLLREGTWTDYRADAVRSMESDYRLGKLDGRYNVWHSNGILATAGSYLEGKKSGRWLTYSPNGQLGVEHDFADGMMHGSFIAYYPDGRTATIGQYELGQPAGTWTVYDANGNATSIDQASQEAQAGKKISKRITRIKRMVDTPPLEDVETD